MKIKVLQTAGLIAIFIFMFTSLLSSQSLFEQATGKDEDKPYELNGYLRGTLFGGKVPEKNIAEIKSGYGEASLKLKLRKKDFVVVTDFMMRLKMGKRIHLCEYEADSLADGLNCLFNRYIEIPRIRHGKRQTLDTLISEEALLLAKYLRNEKKEWNPRIPNVEKEIIPQNF